MKYAIQFHHLLQNTDATHAYISSRPSWFLLGVTSALLHSTSTIFKFKYLKDSF